jgi:hypothetical protein
MALKSRAAGLGATYLHAVDVKRLEKVQEQQAEIASELKVATHELNNLTNRARRFIALTFAFSLVSGLVICLVGLAIAYWELEFSKGFADQHAAAVTALAAHLSVHAQGAQLLPASLGHIPAFILVGFCALLLAISGGVAVIIDSKPRP